MRANSRLPPPVVPVIGDADPRTGPRSQANPFRFKRCIERLQQRSDPEDLASTLMKALFLERISCRLYQLDRAKPAAYVKTPLVRRAIEDARLHRASDWQVRALRKEAHLTDVRELFDESERPAFDDLCNRVFASFRGSDAVLRQGVEPRTDLPVEPNPPASPKTALERPGTSGVATARSRTPSAPRLAPTQRPMPLKRPHSSMGVPPMDVVSSLVADIAPVVTKTTGLPLDLSRVEVRVLSREQSATELRDYVKRERERAGLPREPVRRHGGPREALHRLQQRLTGWLQSLAGGTTFAYSVPHETDESTRSFVRLMERDLSPGNADFLRITLFHELTHIAQYQNWPELSAHGRALRMDWARAHDAVQSLPRGAPAAAEHEEALKSIGERLWALKCMHEGHATLLHRVSASGRYGHSRYGRRPLRGVLERTARTLLPPRLRPTRSPYVTGSNRLAQVCHDPTLMTALCTNPCLVELLFMETGDVHLGFLRGVNPAERSAVIERVKALNDKADALRIHDAHARSTSSAHGAACPPSAR